MGQIIAFPTAPAVPHLAANLGTADCILLLAIRWWAADFRLGIDPIPRLRDALTHARACNAAILIDAFMSVVARTVRRPATINGPRCPQLSADEQQLLYAASLTQDDQGKLAEKALRTALLSAEGAAFAVGELEALGALFSQVCLFFGRRTSPAANPDNDSRTAWSPPAAWH